jgi:integrase
MPSHRLTARDVETIKPTAKLVALRDSLVPGLELRIRPATKGGAKSWSVRYRIHRQQRRLLLGRYPILSLADARGRARRVLRDVALGTDPQAMREAEAQQREAEARRVTFGSLAATYIEKHARPRKRTWKTDRRYLMTECKAWKARLATDITRRDVRDLVEAIGDRGAPITANRVLEVVRSMFNFAVDRELVETNPAARCKKPGIEHSRDRVLSDDEIRRFWAALDAQLVPMASGFRLQLLTAQRGGEVFDMRWQDVDLDGAWWTIPGECSKNGLPHRVPLSTPALEIVKVLRAQEGDNPYVLAGARGRCQRCAAVKAIGIPDFVGHDLRRTAATRMAIAGVPRFVIARVLNHVDTGVTAVYDRATYDTEKRGALETWALALDAILRAEVSDTRDSEPVRPERNGPSR